MKFLTLFLISIVFISCKNEIKVKNKSDVASETKKNYQKPNEPYVDLGDLILYIDADQEDFDVSYNNDTIRIEQALYKTLDGGILKPKEGYKILNIFENIFFDVKQYTIDDNPATSLELNITKEEISKKEINEYIFKPVKTYENWLQNFHFDEIKTRSISYQNDFFNNLKKNKNKYTECCKEYLVQADTFLNSDKNNFKIFKDLNIEPYIKQRNVKIKYSNKNISKEKIIVYE